MKGLDLMTNTNETKKTTSAGGVSIFTVLTLIFVVLKLVGVIEWSWIWVFSPIWIPIALCFVIIVPIVIIAIILKFIRNKKLK